MGAARGIFVFLTDILQTILIAASIFVVIYMFLFRPFQVSGASMFPNFTDKEYVLTNLIVYRFQAPQKGDIVVFNAPVDEEKDFIKRIIASEGDVVMISNGLVYLNKNILNETPYLKPEVKTYGGAFLREGQEVEVPPGKYFVLGDNRSYSSDSREWGFVNKGEIIGRSMFVYWPITNARAITSSN